jgi:hypothetical protein
MSLAKKHVIVTTVSVVGVLVLLMIASSLFRSDVGNDQNVLVAAASQNVLLDTAEVFSEGVPAAFTTSVQEGSAPLSVTFSIHYLSLLDHWVDFGDGTVQDVTCLEYSPDTDACTRISTGFTHQYVLPGTYIARYMSGLRSERGNGETIATQVITVR